MQFGFVAISVCVLVFEFDVFPLLSNKPEPRDLLSVCPRSIYNGGVFGEGIV